MQFLYKKIDTRLSCCGIVKSVKKTKDKYVFSFDDGNKLEILDKTLLKCLVKEDNDCISFEVQENPRFISGIAAFSMFDTYGFPMEITQEILAEDGYELDTESFYLLRRLQKELSSGTFKNKDGWHN